MKDAFDQWWDWADKQLDSNAIIPASIYYVVVALAPEDRLDRAKVNAAVALVQSRPLKD
jgi:hypothetical protein